MRTEDFKEFVKTAKKFYDKSRTISQTQSILFSGNTATIINFSDNISVWLELEDVSFDNPFTVPFLEFEKVISKVKDSSISFSVDDEFRVEVITDKGVFTFLGDKEVNDFPVFIKNKDSLESLTILDSGDLTLIKKAEVFAAQDELRPVMNNVFVDTNTIVASDAHFICFYPTENKRETPFLIPKK
jgi:DNA polymerase III sliding clamp (beta) subunit (PCNA family)